MRVELRPPRLEEATALARVLGEFAQAYGSDHEPQSDIEGWFTSPGMDLEHDARVALADGEIVGYGDVRDPGGKGSAVDLDLRFHPDHPEVVEPLAGFAEKRAHELVKPGGTIRAWSTETAEPLLRQIGERGFTFSNYSLQMGMSLNGDLPEPEWPEDIELRPSDRIDARRVYEVSQETFEDTPGHVRDPYEEWAHWALREPFDPEFWFLAFDGGELVGTCLCRPYHGHDQDCGWVHALGVRRPWRRRGLGLALLRHALLRLRAHGNTRAGLGVHARIPAVTLYERAGMNVLRTSLWFHKEV